MIWIPIIAMASLCGGCQTGRLPSPPPLPPGAQSALPVEVVSVPSPPKPLAVVWNYPLPLPQPDLTFELFAANAPAGPFAFFTNASAPPIRILPLATQQFFILRARDITTGLVSEWNQ